MRKTLLLLSSIALMANASDEIIMLDLTKAETKLTFEEADGSWTGTYDEDIESIDSQCFSFIHSAITDYFTWWGFTVSNAANNSYQENLLNSQFCNMAAGGIVLDESGKVKLNEAGAPEISAEVPYMVAYYGEFFSARPTQMVFNDQNLYEPQGVYINLTAYPYYCLEFGNAPARPFTNGDSFSLTIHGVAADETEKTVKVDLASYTNGDLTLNRGWKYVDLTSLGAVNELYFTMESTDTGAWGMNTPSYFALDKLSVKQSSQENIVAPNADGITLKYDRAGKTASWTGVEFADVQNVAGQTVMAGTDGELNLSSLPAGVYVVRAGARTIKIVR